VMKPTIWLTFVIVLWASQIKGQLIKKDEATRVQQLLNKISSENQPATYLIRNADVITMKDSVILLDYDVLVENSKIKQIGKDIEAVGTKEINANGRFLMPGLVDMHAHLFLQHPLTQTWILHHLIYGVTTLRDMNGSTEKLLFRDKISRNELLAPNIYQATPLIDSRKDKFFTQIVTPEEAIRFVQEAKKSGYDFIKIYDGLKEPVYDVILQESHRQQMLVVGHLPHDVKIEKALQSKQSSIEHLTGYFQWKGPKVEATSLPEYGKLTANSDTWNCPTIYNHFLNGSREGAAQVLQDSVARLIPESLYNLWSKRQSDQSKQVSEIVDIHGAGNFQVLIKILKDLYQSNAKILVGTDAGNLPFLIPGYALHKEMVMFSSVVGMPNYKVLKMVTSDAATAMNVAAEFGTIEEGKRADLILLSGNPIENLKFVHSPEGIMVRGVWISSELRSKVIADLKSIFGN
jgi:hypothetical protein